MRFRFLPTPHFQWLRRWRWRAALAYVLLFPAIFVLSQKPAATTELPVASQWNATLAIEAPAQVAAGSPFSVLVKGAAPQSTVTLQVQGNYGPRTFTTVANGQARFDIPAADWAESGTLTLLAFADEQVGVNQLEILPDVAVDPVDTYVGPRTVWADSQDFTMAVTVPKDTFGNPVADDTAVAYDVTRANGQSQKFTSKTRGLLSYITAFSTTTSGRSTIAITSGDANGTEESFLEVAGPPATITLTPQDELPLADGRTLLRLRTEQLFDQFDNELPDGIIADLLVNKQDTIVRRLQKTVQKGTVEFTVEAPDEASELTFIVAINGVQSEPLILSFETAVNNNFSATSWQLQDGEWVTGIGEVVTAKGSYIPDGAVATITHEDRTYEGAFLEGLALIETPFDPVGKNVAVLDASAIVTAAKTEKPEPRSRFAALLERKGERK